MSHRIKPLPPDIQAQIRASANIISLNDVILGLLENSLDADATRIKIKLDYTRASCNVQDDGDGISSADFDTTGGLAKPHHTSSSRDNPIRLGSAGLFLASIAAVSILSITSKHQAEATSSILVLQYSHVAVRTTDHISDHLAEGHGTEVSVHDLFGNMPVRVKQRPTREADHSIRAREWTSLCRLIIGTLLARGKPIHVSMEGVDSGQNFRINTMRASNQRLIHASFDRKLVESTLRQGMAMEDAYEWVTTSARTHTFTIRALISLEPSASKDLQFFCLGNRYMSPRGTFITLYEAVNRIFDSSNFAASKSSPKKHEDASILAPMRPQGSRIGLERWPRFVARIDSVDPRFKNFDLPQNHLIELKDIIETMLDRFLVEHKFRSRKLPDHEKPVRRETASKAAPLVSVNGSVEVYQSTSKKGLNQKASFRGILSDCPSNIQFPPVNMDPLNHIHKDDVTLRRRFIASRRLGEVNRNSAIALHLKPDRSVKPIKLVSNSAGALNQDTTPITPLNHLEQVPTGGAENSDQISTDQTDEYVSWTDPNTKTAYQLNTRTGCVANESLMRPRPLTVNDASVNVAFNRQDLAPTRLIRSSNGLATPEKGTWADTFLQKWQNPVFTKAEDQIPCFRVNEARTGRTSSDNMGCHTDDTQESNLPSAAIKMSRHDLQDAEVISQVDSKFILVKIRKKDPSKTIETIALIDQHAADERIRVEKLMEELCSPPMQNESFQSPLGHTSAVHTLMLDQPMFFELQHRECALFKDCAVYFARWGILIDLAIAEKSTSRATDASCICRLIVLSLPNGIAQRCKVEPPTLISMLRREAWQYSETNAGIPQRTTSLDMTETNWVKHIHGCPSGILDLLNSRACRSAIMFNDSLSMEQCQSLVDDLAKCQFPFQCAHGRPSMVPLSSLGEVKKVDDTPHSLTEETNFKEAWSRWDGSG